MCMPKDSTVSLADARDGHRTDVGSESGERPSVTRRHGCIDGGIDPLRCARALFDGVLELLLDGHAASKWRLTVDHLVEMDV